MVRLAFSICLVLYGICAQKPTTMTQEDLFNTQFGATTLETSTHFDVQPCNDDCDECSNEGVFESDVIQPKIGSTDNENCQCQCCGIRNEKDAYRILGATTVADHHEFPWIVAILEEDTFLGMSTFNYKCVGSLIHPLAVLTVAHHVSDEPDKFKIRAGRYDAQMSDANDTQFERQVSRVVIHENYQKSGLLNDIALLFLKEQYKIGGNINIICLPPPHTTFDSQRCLVSGWGKDTTTGKHTNILKTVELPIVPKDKCLTELRKAGVERNYRIHDSFICAGGEPGKDTCEGDGGAPLVCVIPNSKNRYHQVGMVSWGIGCGGTTPGGYVNVAWFIDWINKKLDI